MSIVVIGSINIDLVTESNHFPKIGETIIGNSFHTFNGGKGANQAVCASRLGVPVDFIGCVGADLNGKQAVENLANNNVTVKAIRHLDNESTGIAQITIAQNDNSIIIIKGANDKLSKEIINDNLDVIDKADVVLLQLEVPLETVEYVVEYCYSKNIITVLNPAPAMKLSQKLIDEVTFITPNEIEYGVIFDEEYKEGMLKYPNKLIVTKGSSGVDYCDGKTIVNIKAHAVDVVDTTGAGDSFNAGFCVGLVNKMSLGEAISFGNKIASISVRKLGAQTSMPYLDEL